MRTLGRELAYLGAMPFLIALSIADQHWPELVGRWDDFWTEVTHIRTSRHR